MNSTFLYKLFNHSKWAFVCVMVFIVTYFVCMYKKMDMVIFPYNSMYSSIQETEIACYYLKMNGQRVHYSKFMYWKKDFLEQSITKYAGYVIQNKNNYLNYYINEKVKNKNQHIIIQNALTPGKVDFKGWAKWFATFAGIKVNTHDNFELVKYNVQIKNSKLSILDSTILCSTKTKNDD